MLPEQYISLYRAITLSHFIFSLAALVLFLLTLIVVKRRPLHTRLAKIYILTLTLATLVGFLLAGLSIANQTFLGQNQSARFLKAFKSVDLANFGYIISVQRGLVVFLISAHILFLQNVILKKTLRLIHIVLIAATLFTFIFYKNVWRIELWPYHISQLALVTGLIGIYLTLPRLDQHLQHAALAVFSFLIFIETGLLGGVGQMIPWAQTKDMALFTIFRLMPLALTLAFIYFRLNPKKEN